MKWHWLRDKEVLEQLRVYWDKGTNKDADYFTKYHPPIYHRQMHPRQIRTLNLVREISHTIILCEGVLNRVPGTQSCIESLNMIQAKPQSMTKKCHTVRRLNRPRQLIMKFINLSSYFKCNPLQQNVPNYLTQLMVHHLLCGWQTNLIANSYQLHTSRV